MPDDGEARESDDQCRLHAEYLLREAASESEFLTVALFAASAHARAYGPLGNGFHLDAMNLSDEWDEATPYDRERLKPAVHTLARRALTELNHG